MRNLKKFAKRSDYDVYIGMGNAFLPNVSICDDEEGVVHFNRYIERHIPNDEIRYTTVNGRAITLWSTDVFGTNIIDNSYSTGSGIIKFDGEVKYIGKNAFDSHSEDLLSITIPDSITSIGEDSFRQCRKLRSMTIPDSVSTIGDGAFFGCNDLDTILIGDGIKEIGSYAFHVYSHSEKVNVFIKAEIPPLCSSPFYLDDICTIYVPSNSIDAYKTSVNWSEYASKIKEIPN